MDPDESDPHRDRLSKIVEESGLEINAFARSIGVDSGTVARWLSQRQAIPGTRAEWIDSYVGTEIRDGVVWHGVRE